MKISPFLFILKFLHVKILCRLSFSYLLQSNIYFAYNKTWAELIYAPARAFFKHFQNRVLYQYVINVISLAVHRAYPRVSSFMLQKHCISNDHCVPFAEIYQGFASLVSFSQYISPNCSSIFSFSNYCIPVAHRMTYVPFFSFSTISCIFSFVSPLLHLLLHYLACKFALSLSLLFSLVTSPPSSDY